MKKHITIAILLFTLASFAQNYKFGKVSKEELEEKYYPLDSTAEAAYLYKKKKIHYTYDGELGWKLITEVHERVKVYNKEGFKYAAQKISLYKGSGGKEIVYGIKGYTYALEKGKIKKQKLSKKEMFTENVSKNRDRKKFTMPSLKEGCVVEWKYKIASPYYYYIDNVILQHNIPIKEMDISVRIPEYFVFKNQLKGFLFVNVLRKNVNKTIHYFYREGGRTVGKGFGTTVVASKNSRSTDLVETIYSIRKSNTPALKKEAYVSNMNNYRSEYRLELSYTKFPYSTIKKYSSTWKSVAKRIYKSAAFGEELHKKYYYKKELAEIEKTFSGNAKIAAIFQFVQSKVKWNGYYGKYVDKGVKKAYKEGAGNAAEINLILTSMLRSAGFDANPVLVSTRNHGVPMFPTLKGFNYVISSVLLPNNKTVLLDATEEYSLPNVLPIRALNWRGRLVKKDGTSYSISLEPSRHSVEDNRVSVKIDGEGSVGGMMMTKFTNHNAMSFRKKNNILKDEEVRSWLEEKYLIEVGDFKISNKKNLGKPMAFRLKFTSDDLVEEIGEKLYVKPLLFLANTKNPFKLEDRKFPVDFARPWKDKNTVTIQIPEGYQVTSVPESVAIGIPDGLGVFKYQVKLAGNKIKIISLVQINQRVISQEYYQYLKDFYKKMVEKQSEKIVLIKK